MKKIKKLIPQQIINIYHFFTALFANIYFGFPSRKLKIIGVTGTDGKTTTATLIYHLLKSSGKKVALISTVAAYIGKDEIDIGFHVTTPEPWQLQKLIKKISDSGYKYLVLEATSHGFDQHRLFGVNFEIGVLTNITNEHLDYHKTFDKYVKAKSKLFRKAKVAILNKEDKSFKKIKKYIPDTSEIIAYKTNYLSSNIQNAINKRFPEHYNVLNATAAVCAAEKAGIKFDLIPKSILTFPGVVGRMEEIKNDLGIRVIVDFAHTPNALKEALNSVRPQLPKGGKLISVFGCASERDERKRPAMGKISGELADVSIFTAEDPRRESIHKIIDEIVIGAKKSGAVELTKLKNEGLKKTKHKYFVRIPERGEAIAFAIQKLATKGDVVIICGKGHEKSMSYDGVEHPWSDSDFIKTILKSNEQMTAVILAAGKGTRLKSEKPKVIHHLVGRPMIAYTLSNLRSAGFKNISVVIGYEREQVIREIGPSVTYVVQDKLIGTGYAANCGMKSINSTIKDVFILNGDDSSFYKPSTLVDIYKTHKDNKSLITVISLKVKDPFGLGRIVKDKSGKLISIVEEKDADPKIRLINEINIGAYVINREWFLNNYTKIKPKKQGEYLLTDIVEIAVGQKQRVGTYTLKNLDEWHGINTPQQLAEADKKMRERYK